MPQFMGCVGDEGIIMSELVHFQSFVFQNTIIISQHIYR